MFIVLEGLDGAGKSTQTAMLKQYFESKGKKVFYLHFPRFEAPVFGDMIAAFLRGDFGSVEEVHPMVVALLFAGDRREAAQMIRAKLDEGYCIIADRYLYSNIAFQCSKVANEDDRLKLRDWIFDTEYNKFGIPVPTLNLFLDVPINFVDNKLNEQRSGDDRAYLNGKQDIHEADIEFQKRVREIYLSECNRGSDLIRIDCSNENGEMLSAEGIFELIKMMADNVTKE